MEAWEDPAARVDNLALMSSRTEIEARDVTHALAMLNKLLSPNDATRLKGRLIFDIRGYEDPRELFEIPEIRAWIKEVDKDFPYWFYFMDVGTHPTINLIAFALCRWDKVPGGKLTSAEGLQDFLITDFIAMNQLARRLGNV
jgi:hypothetical protein